MTRTHHCDRERFESAFRHHPRARFCKHRGLALFRRSPFRPTPFPLLPPSPSKRTTCTKQECNTTRVESNSSRLLRRYLVVEMQVVSGKTRESWLANEMSQKIYNERVRDYCRSVARLSSARMRDYVTLCSLSWTSLNKGSSGHASCRCEFVFFCL